MICPIDVEMMCAYEDQLESGDMTCEGCEVLAVDQQRESRWQAHYLKRFEKVQ